ncbi:MAG: AAA family ATPase [Parachlamydiales bacterium]|nr:AAA family ATPase [Parachlamydiales bacterium]
MKVQFDPTFKKALDILEESNNNIFITGKAGTGKSTLLSFFVDNTKKSVAVIAPTGVAALNIKGETIHSFCKFKTNVTIDSARRLGRKIKKDSIYSKLDSIIIDEISMVRADLLDCMDQFLQMALKSKKSFGGIRMIFIGDLYQLPPVVTKDEKKHFDTFYETPFFFSSKVMKNALNEFDFIELDKIYRQSDKTFIDILNGIRNNSVSDKQIFDLNQKVDESDTLHTGYIYLTSTNALAEQINLQKLSQLEGETYFFEADISDDFEMKYAPTDRILKLKKDAQVMFLNNNSDHWVNGTIGKIVKISEEEIIIETEDNKTVELGRHNWNLYNYIFDEKSKKLKHNTLGSFEQYPIKLAWAVTIHKSQGLTFDKVLVDLSKGVFAHGQTYVALSRCKNFDGLKLKKPIKKSNIIMDYRVIKFLTEFQYQLSDKALSKEDKISIIQKAIDDKKPISITYLKSNDEKSKRTIIPEFVGNLSYKNKTYLGIKAFCTTRKENRIFRVDRILEISK